MLRQCSLRNVDPEVLITYNGKHVNVGHSKALYFPHGSVLSASCRQVGKFKFNGNGTMTCFNGNWYNGKPTCTKTSFYKNMSGKLLLQNILLTAFLLNIFEGRYDVKAISFCVYSNSKLSTDALAVCG